jgi:hypothetical protein
MPADDVSKFVCNKKHHRKRDQEAPGGNIGRGRRRRRNVGERGAMGGGLLAWLRNGPKAGHPSADQENKTVGLLISVHGDLSLSMAQWRVLHREGQNQGRRD